MLDRPSKRLGNTFGTDDFTDAQAIEPITLGNVRLLERLFPQIAPVLKISRLATITEEVEAAASIPGIGISLEDASDIGFTVGTRRGGIQQ